MLHLFMMCCFFLSCNYNNKSPVSSSKQDVIVEKSRDNSSIQQSNQTLKYDEYVFVKDTMKISSNDDLLDYPFGCFKAESDLSHRLNNLKHKQEVYQENGEVVKLDRYYSGNSFIKFYLVERYGDNKIRYEIVSAKIHDSQIVLSNGVHVGMSKTDFFTRLPATIKCNMSEINVVKFYWDVLGISHYYYFNNDTLTSIMIDTDFLVNKN